MQPARTYTRPCRSLTGHTVARRDEGIGAVIDVQQRALRTFEQQISAGLVDGVKICGHIGHHRPDLFGIGHGLVEHSLKLDRFGAQVLGENKIVIVEHLRQLFRKALRIEQIVDPQGTTGNFVFVGGANAFAGRTNLVTGTLLSLPGTVERRVVAKDDRTAWTDPQALADLDAARLQPANLLQQVMNVQHHAVTDVALHPLPDDAGWHQIQLVLGGANYKGMTCIMPPLKTHHALSLIGQPVDDLAFAFVTPLGTDHNYVLCHFSYSP